MWTPRSEYSGLGENETERQKIYRDVMAQSLSADVIQKIRPASTLDWYLARRPSVIRLKHFAVEDAPINVSRRQLLIGPGTWS
jgi:hypothetical protein